MCGIIGFAGKTEAVPILLDGLERLEYRGYDSAGVAVVSADGRLQVKKSKGRLSVLRELLDSQNPLSGNIGIGHTRWATHGEPNDTNAHLAHTRTVTYMEDDEVAVITADDVQIFDRDRFLLEKEKHLIEWDVSAAEKYAAIIRELQDLPEKISVVMNDLDLYQKAASRYFNHNSVFYIGRNLDYALGLEGSLKLKEISYIHSESYAAGELKHGTISLIEPGTLVVAMVTYEPLVEKSLSNIVEVKSRGAEVIAMTTDQTAELISSQASEMFVIPKPHSLLQPVLGVIPLQLFAYYVALNRGCDIISQGIWQNRSQ